MSPNREGRPADEKGQGIKDSTSKAYMTSAEMLDLIAFFYSQEFDHLCEDVLRIPINPVAVRERVGLPASQSKHSTGKSDDE